MFGLRTSEVKALRSTGYRPRDLYESDPQLKLVIDQIAAGAFSPEEPGRFLPIVQSLLDQGDHYQLLADFARYVDTQQRVDALYANSDAWTTMAIRNVAAMGVFSSDRTILEYANNIWGVHSLNL